MLYAAAILIVATGLAHSYLGEKYILVRLFRRPDLPRLFGGTDFTVGTLRFAWHITTIAWFCMGALLLIAASEPLSSSVVLRVTGVAALASAVLPIIFTRGRHLSWVVFILVGVLTLMAA